MSYYVDLSCSDFKWDKAFYEGTFGMEKAKHVVKICGHETLWFTLPSTKILNSARLNPKKINLCLTHMYEWELLLDCCAKTGAKKEGNKKAGEF